MLWVSVILKYSEDIRSDKRDAERSNQNFAMVFEENVLRSIGEIDKALLYLRRSIETRKDSTDFSTIANTTDVLSEISDAFRYLGEGHTRGKVVIAI